MYQNTTIPVVPAAATGIVLTTVGTPWYYTLCAMFAIIGAVFALKRILPSRHNIK